MSLSDLSGRLPRPRIAFERRPLSNSASTASCSMRFSFRRMTSGARCMMSFCSRLLRLMTRRYRSFRSDVAKRPPSSGTSGRRSGGITGMTSRIIHSGLLRVSPASPELRKASTILSRLSICFLRCWRRLGLHVLAQLVGDLVDVQTPEQLAHGGRADVCLEGIVARLARLRAKIEILDLHRAAGSARTSCSPGSMTT